MVHSKLYIKLMNSARWKKLRAKVLYEQPLCQECLKQGHVRAARVVHHLTEVESGRTDAECEHLAFSRSNLQALCFQCHHQIHAEKHSHSKAAHQLRQQQRLEQWVQRQKGICKPPDKL